MPREPRQPSRPQAMTDTALRAITDDGAFRVIAVRTTETVLGASAAQEARGDVRRLFGELLTGSILIRHTMAPDLRVQAILQGDDRASRMVADANPDGSSRGLVQLAKGAREMPIGKRGLLQVARTLQNGSIHQGVVAVPEDGSLSGALMRYMQDSEQIVSIAALGCLLTAAGDVQVAGGFVLQLLPEVGEGPLAIITERMRDFEKIGPAPRRAAPPSPRRCCVRSSTACRTRRSDAIRSASDAAAAKRASPRALRPCRRARFRR